MDIDELLNEWKRFRLMDREIEHHITLEDEEEIVINGQVEKCLIGKLLTSRVIALPAIKNVLSGAWKTRNKVSFETMGKNVFLFRFEDHLDKEWVFKNGPWLFDKYLIALEEPCVNNRISDMEFKEVAFWMRLINLPIGFRSRSVAEKIGNKIGKFLEMDTEKDEFSWGNSMRVNVQIDISKPLIRGFMLKSNGIKEDCWVTIRYERLLDFCFNCGCIGHMAKECLITQAKEGNFEFGAWMRFQGFFRTTTKTDGPKKKEENPEGEIKEGKAETSNEKGKGIITMEENSQEEDKRMKEGKTKSYMFETGNCSNLNMNLIPDINMNLANRIEMMENMAVEESSSDKQSEENNSVDLEIPTRKKSSWKRRTRVGSVENKKEEMVVLSGRKRKGK